jgi:hypothetical protein
MVTSDVELAQFTVSPPRTARVYNRCERDLESVPPPDFGGTLGWQQARGAARRRACPRDRESPMSELLG